MSWILQLTAADIWLVLCMSAGVYALIQPRETLELCHTRPRLCAVVLASIAVTYAVIAPLFVWGTAMSADRPTGGLTLLFSCVVFFCISVGFVATSLQRRALGRQDVSIALAAIPSATLGPVLAVLVQASLS